MTYDLGLWVTNTYFFYRAKRWSWHFKNQEVNEQCGFLTE